MSAMSGRPRRSVGDPLARDCGEIIMVPDIETAADLCLARGSRVFLTTGTKTLAGIS